MQAHPRLLDAYRQLGNYMDVMEKYDPASKKSAFFYSGPESLKRVKYTGIWKKWQNAKKENNAFTIN